ncbi:MAG: DUF6242 domain-containing protein [Prevotellaceae bacterium]|jgi:hypothetical protein|nr:DUF6242 domain-containing protein [Prevotellaceae bacterium]
MKIKNLLLIAVLLPLAFFSCKKEDDKDQEKVITDDPRIRSMSISALPATFVVNDIEELIFNYDSLAYGTDIDSLHPVFAGYGGALSFQYKYGEKGEWKNYSNQSTTIVNFDSVSGSQKLAVFFRSFAPDSSYTKEYKISIRVHEYDVDAFEWENAGTLPVQGTVVSQKAVFYNQKYYFFYRNDSGKSFVIISSTGETWGQAAEIAIGEADWTTLTSLHQPQKLVVQAGNVLYTCDLSENSLTFAPLNAGLPEGCTLKVPLFTLGNNFWIVGNETGTNFLYSLANNDDAFRKGPELSGRVPVEEINTSVLPSGSTMIGYIFGGKGTNGKGTVWGVDANGDVMELSQDQSVFPHLIYPMPVFFGNKLCLAGGIGAGKYTGQFYVSSNSGATWSNDRHKTLPDKIGAIAKGVIFRYERNRLILIGGETEAGFSPNVWKGTLKQEILDSNR